MTTIETWQVYYETSPYYSSKKFASKFLSNNNLPNYLKIGNKNYVKMFIVVSDSFQGSINKFAGIDDIKGDKSYCCLSNSEM